MSLSNPHKIEVSESSTIWEASMYCTRTGRFMLIYAAHKTQNSGRKRYFLIMTPPQHRYVAVRLLRDRIEARQFIYDRVGWLERNSKTYASVKRIHRANAKEFLSMKVKLKK